jgi:hypothetical protein
MIKSRFSRRAPWVSVMLSSGIVALSCIAMLCHLRGIGLDRLAGPHGGGGWDLGRSCGRPCDRLVEADRARQDDPLTMHCPARRLHSGIFFPPFRIGEEVPPPAGIWNRVPIALADRGATNRCDDLESLRTATGQREGRCEPLLRGSPHSEHRRKTDRCRDENLEPLRTAALQREGSGVRTAAARISAASTAAGRIDVAMTISSLCGRTLCGNDGTWVRNRSTATSQGRASRYDDDLEP